MTVLSPLWSRAIDWKGRRTVVPLAFHVFAASAIVFAVVVALALDAIIVGRVFYIWHAVFNMFAVSVFWSLLADLLNHETARRLFGPISAGGTVGAFAGPLVIKLFADDIGPEGVLVVSAGLLELSVIGVAQIRIAGAHLAKEPPVREAGAFAGIGQVITSSYLRPIAGYVLCTAALATFLYFEQIKLVRAEIPDRGDRLDYYATIDLWTSIGTFVLQTFVTARLLKWVGPGVVLVVLPIAQVAGLAAVVLAPSLVALVFAQAGGRAITHGLTRPARELLFTVVEPDEKYRAKNAIDTIGYRFGDVATAWLHTGLVSLAGAGALVVASAPIAVIWIVLASVAGAKFLKETRGPSRSAPSDA
jgi:AAA family ATP:ADP antiporter